MDWKGRVEKQFEPRLMKYSDINLKGLQTFMKKSGWLVSGMRFESWTSDPQDRGDRSTRQFVFMLYELCV